MKILAFNWRDMSHPRAGGAEVYLQSVAREWVALGHQVTVFCAAVDGRPDREVVEGVRYLRRGGRLSVYREARRYWREHSDASYDLVIDSVNTRPFLCPRFVRHTPVVAIIHQLAKEVWYYEVPWPVAVIGRYILEPWWLRSYRDVPVITVSESSRVSLVEYGLRNVTVVAEGFDLRCRGGSIEKESAPTLVFVGRLSSNKRPDHALKVFELVQREIPDAKMWFIGSGPAERALKRRAGENVEFLGRLSDQERNERVSRAHLLLVTSSREGWGLVVTEAAALGTPAAGYDVPGLRDSLRASGGVIAQPAPKALADLVVGLLREGHINSLRATPGGVLPWREVAAGVLRVASGSEVEG